MYFVIRKPATTVPYVESLEKTEKAKTSETPAITETSKITKAHTVTNPDDTPAKSKTLGLPTNVEVPKVVKDESKKVNEYVIPEIDAINEKFRGDFIYLYNLIENPKEVPELDSLKTLFLSNLDTFASVEGKNECDTLTENIGLWKMKMNLIKVSDVLKEMYGDRDDIKELLDFLTIGLTNDINRFITAHFDFLNKKCIEFLPDSTNLLKGDRKEIKRGSEEVSHLLNSVISYTLPEEPVAINYLEIARFFQPGYGPKLTKMTRDECKSFLFELECDLKFKYEVYKKIEDVNESLDVINNFFDEGLFDKTDISVAVAQWKDIYKSHLDNSTAYGLIGENDVVGMLNVFDKTYEHWRNGLREPKQLELFDYNSMSDELANVIKTLEGQKALVAYLENVVDFQDITSFIEKQDDTAFKKRMVELCKEDGAIRAKCKSLEEEIEKMYADSLKLIDPSREERDAMAKSKSDLSKKISAFSNKIGMGTWERKLGLQMAQQKDIQGEIMGLYDKYTLFNEFRQTYNRIVNTIHLYVYEDGTTIGPIHKDYFRECPNLDEVLQNYYAFYSKCFSESDIMKKFLEISEIEEVEDLSKMSLVYLEQITEALVKAKKDYRNFLKMNKALDGIHQGFTASMDEMMTMVSNLNTLLSDGLAENFPVAVKEDMDENAAIAFLGDFLKLMNGTFWNFEYYPPDCEDPNNTVP